MLNFFDYPKQWIIAKQEMELPLGGQADKFGDFQIQTADEVPLVRIETVTGEDVGRVIGWSIDDGVLNKSNHTITLGKSESVESHVRELSGRFVVIWRDVVGNVLFREDCSGGFPAVYSTKSGVIASTVSILNEVFPHESDDEVNAIFSFPKQRGFLPFGLTSRKGIKRLMPNYVLNTLEFEAERVWPTEEFMTAAKNGSTSFSDLTSIAADKLKKNVQAVVSQGETVLYLSGGHDSRMVLAAADGLQDNLRCETIGDSDALDVHIAHHVCEASGFKHSAIQVKPVSRSDVSEWLHRTGFCMFDPVTELTTTAEAFETPGLHPLTGTGAELARATNWIEQDIGSQVPDLDTIMKRIRVPDVPVLRDAGSRWLESLPGSLDAADVMDIAKIEQIHGCWAGSAVYGHKISLPSLSPFSGQWWNEIALSLSPKERLGGGFYRAYMDILWPELAQIPANKAVGLARLKFWKQELRSIVPAQVKRWLKPLR